MPRYVLLVKGAGEGCDYTLGCNRSFEFLDAESIEDAMKIARKKFQGPDAYIPWESAYLTEMREEIPVSQWSEEELELKKSRAQAKKEAGERAEFERLKAKFEG